MISVTKIFFFDTAHAISNYDGPCKNVHGHRYELHVTVSATELNEGGFIMDFKLLKSIVHEAIIKKFDHTLLLKDTDSNQTKVAALATKIYWMEEEPTAEYLVTFMAAEIALYLPDGVSLKRIKLFETNSSYAEWELV